MLPDTTRLTCCYVIFLKQAMFKAHAAVCYATDSMMNRFGEGLEKIKRMFDGKNWDRCVVICD